MVTSLSWLGVLLVLIPRAQGDEVLPSQSEELLPSAPPPMHHMLPEPLPPPPALVAGLRSLLSALDGCDAACLERGEDWFEQGVKWGASSVASMVRLGLQESFVGALSLPTEGADEVRRRLRTISTTVAPEHSEL